LCITDAPAVPESDVLLCVNERGRLLCWRIELDFPIHIAICLINAFTNWRQLLSQKRSHIHDIYMNVITYISNRTEWIASIDCVTSEQMEKGVVRSCFISHAEHIYIQFCSVFCPKGIYI
jgi:hypothetical protein